MHAADATVHFPEYVPHIKRARSKGATSASGHHIPNEGRFTVNAEVAGHDLTVPFNHMKVKLPILAPRRMMSRGSRITLTLDDGVIENPTTKQTLPFIVFDDLRFAKLKVKPPGTLKDVPMPQAPDKMEIDLPASGFGRLGD